MEGARRSGDIGERRIIAVIRFRVGAHGIDVCQAGAHNERTAADPGDGGGDGDARQAGAASERIPPDAGDGGGDGDARQAGAARECIAVDVSDGGGDGDAR